MERTLRVPSQNRAVRTRAQLLAGGQAAFSEHGYAGATARVIAKAAGVSVGTLYQYFNDRDHLLAELARMRTVDVGRKVLGILQAPVEAEGAEIERMQARLRRVVIAVMEAHQDDPALHAVLTERRHADEVIDRITTGAERMMVQEIDSLLQRWGRPGDTNALAFILFTLVEGAIHTHVLGEPMLDDDRFIEALVNALGRLI